MNITEIRINIPPAHHRSEKIRAFVSIVIENDFILNELRLVEINGRVQLCTPDRPKVDACPTCRKMISIKGNYCPYCGSPHNLWEEHYPKFEQIFNPLNVEARRWLEDIVLDEYSRVVERMEKRRC